MLVSLSDRESHSFRPLRQLGRMVVLSLFLALSLQACGSSSTASTTTTITISSCTEANLRSAIAAAPSGAIIKFSCSGTILLTSTLQITKDLTLDGNGQQVTLDGQNQVEVLDVGGVSFALKDLTIAHGSNGDYGEATGGGGLQNEGGTVSISNSTFTNNSAFKRGGISNSGALTISSSTLINNTDDPGAVGGGLISFDGTVSITNSTFAHNSGGAGGGIIIYAGTMSINDSTIKNNTALNTSSLEGGGGLFVWNTAVVTITNSTIASNTAPSGGGLSISGGPANIDGTIVANNSGGNCSYSGGSTLNVEEFNLESGTDCGFTNQTSLQNTDPKLDPNGLQNNGGPTQTIALQPGSPALDVLPFDGLARCPSLTTPAGSIPPSSSDCTYCPTTDQRGYPRPDNSSEDMCDIGAYESNYP